MFYFAYISSFIIAICFIGFRLRKPDLLTMTILGTAYYSSSLLFGEVYDPDIGKYVDINDFIYAFYALLLILFTFATFINDSVLKRQTYINEMEIPQMYFYFLIVILTFIFLGLNLVDSRTFFPDEVGGFSASSYSSIYNIYWVSTLLLVTGAFKGNSNFLKLASIFFLLTTLLAGSRAYFLAGCFIALLMIYENKSPIRLFLSFKRLFVMIFGFIFLIVYKNIYQYLLMLDLNLLFEASTDFDLILFRLTKGSESVVILNFQHAITLFEQEAGSFIDLVLMKCIPFISELYILGFDYDMRTFSDILNENFYQTVSYGMASSFWGLFYYVSGPLGSIFISFLYVLAILYLNRRIKRKDMFGFHLVPAAIFIGFYLTRLEIGPVLFPFYMSILILFTYKILYTVLPKKLLHD